MISRACYGSFRFSSVELAFGQLPELVIYVVHLLPFLVILPIRQEGNMQRSFFSTLSVTGVRDEFSHPPMRILPAVLCATYMSPARRTHRGSTRLHARTTRR